MFYLHYHDFYSIVHYALTAYDYIAPAREYPRKSSSQSTVLTFPIRLADRPVICRSHQSNQRTSASQNDAKAKKMVHFRARPCNQDRLDLVYCDNLQKSHTTRRNTGHTRSRKTIPA